MRFIWGCFPQYGQKRVNAKEGQCMQWSTKRYTGNQGVRNTNPTLNGDELWGSGRIRGSCFTNDIRRFIVK